MESLQITTSYITLGQFLKRVGVIDSGGAAKWYLAEREVSVNGEAEDRRGRKLYDKDTVAGADFGSFIVTR